MVTNSLGGLEASGTAAIATQTMMAKAADGNLCVKLASNSSANLPVYDSAGLQRRWLGSVQRVLGTGPSSNQPLCLRAVGVAMAGSPGENAVARISESDVIGPIADLAARPVKGLPFTADRRTNVLAVPFDSC